LLENNAGRSGSLFLLVTVLTQPLLALVSRNLLAFALTPVRHLFPPFLEMATAEATQIHTREPEVPVTLKGLPKIGNQGILDNLELPAGQSLLFSRPLSSLEDLK
jgi:hypothetical protein